MRAAAPVRPPFSGLAGIVAALWLAAAGCGAAGGGRHAAAVQPSAGPTPSIMAPATPITRSLDLTGAPPAPQPYVGRAAPAPTRLSIPALKVDTTVVRLGLNPDKTIEVPSDPGQVGWYARGPAPGQQGPAVLLGHLDSATGPAVFYQLSTLSAGSEVVVSREDGSVARFAVQRVASFPVDSFPTDQVYGVTTDPELRLITCGGQYSLIQRRYLTNVVAFAVLKQ